MSEALPTGVPADRLEIAYPDGPPPWDAAPDCAAVCVGGRYTRQAARAYAGTGIELVTWVDGPSGVGKPTVRQIEAVAAAKDGTDAIQVAAPWELLRAGDDAALRDDLLGVVAAVREVRGAAGVRVVLDADVVGDAARLAAVCDAVRQSGADAVVWSGPVADAAAVRSAAESLRLVVRCAAGDAAGWMAGGADRVGANS